MDTLEQTHLKFRLNILCLRDVPRFRKYLPCERQLLEESPTEGKVIWVDVELDTSSFTQTLEELKTCVKEVYAKNNIEEGWISNVEFADTAGSTFSF